MAIALVDKKSIKLTDEELKTFLGPRRVVIVESGKTMARSLRAFLMQYGSKSDFTIVCDTLEDAKREISAQPTHVLVTELALSAELVALQELPFSNRAEVATIITSPDPSTSTVGMIAETDVDAFLVKPFNGATFKDAIDQALANKIKPSPYWTAVENGKALFKAGKYDEALMMFESSKMLVSKPTLGHYYVAQIREKKGDLKGAQEAYEEGLQSDPQDYRCLLASFDGSMRGANYLHAYDLAKRFHAIYPVNTMRIPELVRLSVAVKRFSDIQDYYKIFKNLEQKDPLLTRIIIAGMLVCAKYSFIHGNKPLALEVMQSAAAVGVEAKILLPEIVRYFAETQNYDEGVRFFDTLSEEDQKNPGILLSYLELLHGQGDSELTLRQGMEIARGKHSTPRVFEILLIHSKKAGRTAEVIQKLLEQANETYPDQKQVFEQAIAS